MTNEAKMIAILAKARKEPDLWVGPVPPFPSVELFARARELALHPKQGTLEERERLKRLIEVSESELHLSWNTILLAVMGQLDEARSVAVQRHRLECKRCQIRLATVAAERNTTISVVPIITLPTLTSDMAQASMTPGARLEILNRKSRDGRLAVGVFEDRDKVTVEVRLQEQVPTPQLVGCLLRGNGPEPLTRYMVLAQNQTGQSFGHVDIPRKLFFEALNGKLEALDIAPVDPALLTAADRTSLSASLQDADDRTRADWKTWLQDAIKPGKEIDSTVGRMLMSLQNQLEPSQ
jgi:hypothetical protein